MLRKPLTTLLILQTITAAGILAGFANLPIAKSLVEEKLPGPYPSSPHYFPVFDNRVTETADSIPFMQNEPSIAINPKKPTNMIVGYNDFDQANPQMVHWAYSIDGGNTWTAGLGTLSETGLSASLWSDTAVAFDSNGNAYLVTMNLMQLVLYVSLPDGSGNAGASWNGPYIVADLGALSDKPAITVDRTGGAHNGNIYIAWVQDYKTSPYKRLLVRTATLVGGVPTFSGAAVEASDASSPYNWGPALTVESSGSLYLAYTRDTHSYFDANAIMISRSDDGGATFTLKAQVVDSSVGGVAFSATGISVTSLPTITTTTDGTVFVAWTDNGAGNMDIQSRASATKGTSWGPRVRVNTVATNDQFLPTAVSPAGQTIYVFYYSRESDPKNHLGGLYYSLSNDDGASFNVHSAFSSWLSNPDVCTNAGYSPCLWGDNDGSSAVSLTKTSQRICAAWGDSRDSANLQDNDVNVYARCIDSTYVVSPHIPIPWWLVILPLPRPDPTIWRVVPLQVCRIHSLVCHLHWSSEILPYNATLTGASPLVNLTAPNLPSGVRASISPSSGHPPFYPSIDLDFSSTTCASLSCLVNVTISATDGTNTTQTTLDVLLSNSPYLTTETDAFNPGESVNLTGIGYTPNSSITFKLDGMDVSGSTPTGGDGNFTRLVNLSTSIHKGFHNIIATDSLGKSANTTFITPKVRLEPKPSASSLQALSPFAISLLVVAVSIISASRLRPKARTSLTE